MCSVTNLLQILIRPAINKASSDDFLSQQHHYKTESKKVFEKRISAPLAKQESFSEADLSWVCIELHQTSLEPNLIMALCSHRRLATLCDACPWRMLKCRPLIPGGRDHTPQMTSWKLPIIAIVPSTEPRNTSRHSWQVSVFSRWKHPLMDNKGLKGKR